MATWLRIAMLACVGAALAAPAAAQAQGKKAESKAERGSEAKKDSATPEEDVVLDNRDMSKKRAEKRRQELEEDPAFATDDPFANTAPDPVALREQRWSPGFGGGYRLGYGRPLGEASSLYDLGTDNNGMLFLWGDFGYWPIPHLFAGIYGSGGYLLPDCSGGASCSGWEARGGLEVNVRILPFDNVTPWVGVGAGYEWMMLKNSTTLVARTVKWHGFELLNLQAGVDVRQRGDYFGIFVSYSMSKFNKYSSSLEDKIGSGADQKDSGSIDSPTTHGWLGIGARGTLE